MLDKFLSSGRKLIHHEWRKVLYLSEMAKNVPKLSTMEREIFEFLWPEITKYFKENGHEFQRSFSFIHGYLEIFKIFQGFFSGVHKILGFQGFMVGQPLFGYPLWYKKRNTALRYITSRYIARRVIISLNVWCKNAITVKMSVYYYLCVRVCVQECSDRYSEISLKRTPLGQRDG